MNATCIVIPLQRARVIVGLVLAGAGIGCAIEPDRDFPPPIAPLSPDVRRAIAVAPVVNHTASAEVAQWTYATRRLLIQLLERSQRFDVVEPTDPRATGVVELSFVDVKDEPYLVSVVYAGEQDSNRKRRAVVEVEWRLAGGNASGSRGERLTSHFFREGADPIETPTVVELESGSFWETPFGNATRANLDLVVRRLAASP
jgi:hypothetical protein